MNEVLLLVVGMQSTHVTHDADLYGCPIVCYAAQALFMALTCVTCVLVVGSISL